MNCRRIEKLMPLFVEGDLDVRDMNAVSLHLNDCRGCSQMMSEYGESQNWLRTYSPAEFDSAFFVDLKQSVMQEIERNPARPTWLQRLSERWFWKPTWAMAMVMLVLAGTLAFYIYSGKTKSDSTEIVNSQDQPEPQQPQQEQRDEKPQPKLGLNNGFNDRLAVQHNQKHFRQTLERIIKDKSPVITPEQSLNFEFIADSLSDNNPIDIGLFEGLTIPEDTTRMEFQTGDPNIRIIWFAPKLNNPQASKIDTD